MFVRLCDKVLLIVVVSGQQQRRPDWAEPAERAEQPRQQHRGHQARHQNQGAGHRLQRRVRRYSNIYTVLYLYYICIHIYDSSGSDDGSSGPPMPYSFRYNVAGDETGTYMAREEESDGTTVQLLPADQSQRTSPRAHL